MAHVLFEIGTNRRVDLHDTDTVNLTDQVTGKALRELKKLTKINKNVRIWRASIAPKLQGHGGPVGVFNIIATNMEDAEREAHAHIQKMTGNYYLQRVELRWGMDPMIFLPERILPLK